MRSLRHLLTWFQTRNLRWIVRRLLTLLRTYGLTSARAKRRVTACTELVERYGGLPSFATPGRVVDADPEFFRALADRGVELAIHGYDHVHFDSLDGSEARRQFERAAAAYGGAGIEFTGFRCPYLSYSRKVNEALPDSLFSYSSNLAIRWDMRTPAGSRDEKILAQLQSFYTPLTAAATVARPRHEDGLVEIPASLPDDFELEHGFKLGDEDIADVWSEIFERTYELGELFAPLFHPESFDRCAPAFERVLASAASRTPPVWIARLSDLADWWLRRAAVQVRANGNGTITVEGDSEATILVRDFELYEGAVPWDDEYAVLQGRSLAVPDGPLPFVGAAPDTPEAPLRWLREEGFVVETGTDADRCAVRLERAAAAGLQDERATLNWIESTSGPLVRVWRWPNGARSAVCIAGDLDALSLRDYVDRIRRA